MHSYYGQNPLLREMEINEPCVRINPVDAEARGIEDGSYVRLFNDRRPCGGQGHLQRRYSPGLSGYRPWLAALPVHKRLQ